MTGVWKYLNREFNDNDHFEEDEANLLFYEVVLDGHLREPLLNAVLQKPDLVRDIISECLLNEGAGITDYVLQKLWDVAEEIGLRPVPGYDFANTAKWKKRKP